MGSDTPLGLVGEGLVLGAFEWGVLGAALPGTEEAALTRDPEVSIIAGFVPDAVC